MLEVTPLHPLFVGEATGVDLRRPLDEATRDAVVAAMDKHAVLVFHDQFVDDAQQMAFASAFGPLETSREADRPGHRMRLDVRMADVSNLGVDGMLLPSDHFRRMSGLANQLWHTDSTFKRIPATYSILSARAIPDEGGDTEFADCRAAYDALSEATKARIAELVAEHSIYTSRAVLGFTDFTPQERAALPAVLHRLVRVHPGSGRASLFIASHAGAIPGMPLAEARLLLADLMEHATQRASVYRHKWRVGDLVVWDNRCTMHRGRGFDLDAVRDMRRTTVADIAHGEVPLADTALA
jgi:alpha-ketoglutarate-dependent 2,4-dichlorophenoxyacetate dioxygenase